MKRLALIAAVFTLAACAAKEEAPVADTTAPAAVAPAAAPADSMTDSTKADSTHADTTKK
jgi:uncharacterized lipoprotein YajG